MPSGVADVVLTFGIGMIADQGRQRSAGEEHLLPRAEDVARVKDRADAVERRRGVDEVKRLEYGLRADAIRKSRRHGNGQRVRLPADVVRDADVAQQRVDGLVAAE